MLKRLLIILIIAVSTFALNAQELEWSVDMNAVFNNREGGNGETPDQTFLFTRVTPQIGVSMDSTRHRIMGGVTWYQPMNDHLHGYKVLPSLYYNYKGYRKGVGLVDFKFGMIPNELRISTLNIGASHHINTPTFLRSDSISYLNPNINGMVFKVDRRHLWLHSWLDWRQIQTNHRREAFQVTGMLGWKSTVKHNNLFQLSAIMSYNHLAKSKQPVEGEGVVDNVVFSPKFSYCRFIGNNFDALFYASAGMLMSVDRDRPGENKWLTRVGFIGQLAGVWKWLMLTENIYVGQRQMPLYEKYGSLLYQGDQFYHNKFYSRTDLVATFLKRDYMDLEARLTYHITDKTTAFWQQLAVRFYIDSGYRRLRKQPIIVR